MTYTEAAAAAAVAQTMKGSKSSWLLAAAQ
jgi:hypothetical protein